MLDKAKLYDFTPCGFITFYADGTIVSANKTLLTWLNFQDQQHLSEKKFSQLLSSGGRLYFQMVMLPMIFREGEVDEINVDFKKADGTTFPCLVNAVVISEPEDDDVLITAVVLKITDRKKLEAVLQKEKKLAEEAGKRFETLANIIPDIIFTALPNGEINFVNKRFYEKFNITDQNFKPSGAFERFHPDDREEFGLQWRKAIENCQPFESETRIQMPDQSYCWYLIKMVPYTTSDGIVSQWFGSCTDVHAHKEKQLDTVKQLNASLTEADQIIGQQEQTLEEISYYQSHSVRKPLANILGLVPMMATHDLKELHEVLLPMLQQSAEELDAVIKTIIN